MLLLLLLLRRHSLPPDLVELRRGSPSSSLPTVAPCRSLLRAVSTPSRIKSSLTAVGGNNSDLSELLRCPQHSFLRFLQWSSGGVPLSLSTSSQASGPSPLLFCRRTLAAATLPADPL
ncbi:hypothetical protein MUK42_27565 [Musa troglodytarum]|uniref:Uncharacterized protein n=1 Tax=Musa troglodytarum TaxID=320322 RepID=A0A9E7JLN8_9LILI|nr:hypothetical protein MUK42_27565 [Musa troglodytarum]